MKILVGSTKGGTGKSTVAVNLAAWLAGEGQDVLVLDTDRQATAKKWVDRRNALEDGLPVVHVAQGTDNLTKPIQDYARRYGQIIVDAGGHDSLALRSAMLVADVLIVPTKASMPDIETMLQTNDLIREARIINPALKAYALVSMAPTNPYVHEAQDANEFLAELDQMVLAPVIVRERKVFRDAILNGKGVVETTNSQAKAEIQLLGQAIFGDFAGN